ncbi:MAG: hypothetical protein EZS28_033632 [Streblomastix strix]|uniref:Protein kinase domain-containing protein n=1 Tax=Streblomastix strix TaxID=222440 RepID=A0A5J4ULC7_9EUKA|nr:MAG: hypothetical protein EZS28_033632 [Streblomastix strix]
MLSFDRKERVSAAEALNHEFFTGEKAYEEIPLNALRLAQTAQNALQKGDNNINQYDLDPSFAFPYSDAKELVNKDPEEEMKTIQNKFNHPQNSRRFGFIEVGAEVLNNIPIPNKDFRAITYDEKGGIFRLGWLEIFKWDRTINEKRKITFEIDLREDISQKTI